MFGTGSRSTGRDVVALVIMSFVALGIVAYWGLMRVTRKMARDAKVLPREAEEPAVGDPSDPIWREVAERRERERALERAAAPGGESARPPGGEGSALEPWQERKGEEISREDAEWVAEAERKGEAERAKFLPMLDAFKPLESDAVQKYRILIEMSVAKGQRPEMIVPAAEGSGARPVVKASKKGLTLQLDGGRTREIPWGDVPAESFYRLARQVAVTESPVASAGELIHLAHLADIAGDGEDAAGLRAQAARIHFRERLIERAAKGRPVQGGRAPESQSGALGRPAFSLRGERYTLVDASGEGLSAEGPGGGKRTFAWKETTNEALYELAHGLVRPDDPKGRALDALHLSRLAAEVGDPSEAAELEQEALALDRLLVDEIRRRPQISLNAAILDEFSWAWDPEDLASADAETANDISGDAPSIFHVYRYMRTLGPARMAAIARREPKYSLLLRGPKRTRGRAFHIKGGFIKRYKSMRWTQHPEHVEAGLRDLDFCFISDRNAPTSLGGMYLVSMPQDVRGFKRGDFVSVTGVYVRRWPYQKPSGRWKWIPWIATMKIKEINIPPPKGWGVFIAVLLCAGLAGGVILFLAARREWSDSVAARERLHTRRRGGRDRIRRKVAEAMRTSDGEVGKSGGDSPGPAPSGQTPAEPDASGLAGGEAKPGPT